MWEWNYIRGLHRNAFRERVRAWVVLSKEGVVVGIPALQASGTTYWYVTGCIYRIIDSDGSGVWLLPVQKTLALSYIDNASVANDGYLSTKSN